MGDILALVATFQIYVRMPGRRIYDFPPIFKGDYMKYDWSLIRKPFFIGLLLTGAGIFIVIYIGWNEATFICLLVGPFLLFCCLVLALFTGWMARFTGWMARSDASRLPEGCDNLSKFALDKVEQELSSEEGESMS